MYTPKSHLNGFSVGTVAYSKTRSTFVNVVQNVKFS